MMHMQAQVVTQDMISIHDACLKALTASTSIIKLDLGFSDSYIDVRLDVVGDCTREAAYICIGIKILFIHPHKFEMS